MLEGKWCDELLEDPSGNGLKLIMNKIMELRLELKKKQDAGLPEDEFAKSNALLAALDAAESIADGYWNELHQS